MYLKSIELVNYRRYKHAIVEFPDGVTAIVGPNGAGKSTLMEAIAWCLYGGEAARTSKGLIKRHGAGASEECKAVLKFVFENDFYEVRRQIGKGEKGYAEAFVNGIKIASGISDTDKQLQKRLHLDRESFFISIFARQKDLNALIDKQPEERKGIISEMLGIETVKKAAGEASKCARIKSDTIEGKEKTLAAKKEITVLKDEQSQRKKRIEELEKQLEAEREAEKILKMELENYSKQEEKLEKLQAEHARWKAEQAYVEESIEETNNRKLRKEAELKNLITSEERLKKLSGVEQRYNELKKLQEKLAQDRLSDIRREELKKRIEDLQKKDAQFETTIKNLSVQLQDYEPFNAKLKALEDAAAATRKELSGLTVEIGSLRTTKEKLEKDLKDVRAHLNKIKELGPDSTCPLCERVLGEHADFLHKKHEKKVAETEAELKKTEVEYKLSNDNKLKKEKQLELQETEIKKLRTKVERLATLKGEYNEQLKARDRVRNDIKAFESQFAALAAVRYDTQLHKKTEEELVLIDKQRIEYHKLETQLARKPEVENEIEVLSKKISEYKERMAAIERSIAQLGFDATAYADLKQKIKNMNEKLRFCSRTIANLESEKKIAMHELESIGKEIETIQQMKEEIAADRKSMYHYEKLHAILDDFRVYLLKTIAPQLSGIATQHLQMLTDGKYDSIEFDDDFEMMIGEGGENYPVEKYSGGETDLISLSVRLAISQLVAERSGVEFKFVVLDEIFGSQDVVHRKNILNALNALSKRFSQVLVITHIDDVKEAVENVIEVNELPDKTAVVKIK